MGRSRRLTKTVPELVQRCQHVAFLVIRPKLHYFAAVIETAIIFRHGFGWSTWSDNRRDSRGWSATDLVTLVNFAGVRYDKRKVR